MSRIKENKSTTVRENNLDIQIFNIQKKSFADPDLAYTKIMDMFQRDIPVETIKIFCISQIDQKPLTVRSAMRYAILNSKENKETPEKSYTAYKLALKLEDEDCKLTIDDKAHIKKVTGEVFKETPEVLGFIWDIIG